MLKGTVCLLLTLFFSVLFSETSLAELVPGHNNQCTEEAATLVSSQGRVEKKIAGSSSWQLVGVKAVYCQGDSIRVRQNSRAALLLDSDIVIRLDQNSIMTLGVQKDKRPLLLKLLHGVLYYFSIKPRLLELETPFVNGAVEGTEFVVTVSEMQSQISVFEGQLLAKNSAGSLAVGAGQTATAGKNKKPVSTLFVKGREIVQWALYYPPLLDLQDFSRPEKQLNETQKNIATAIALFFKGDLYSSLKSLEDHGYQTSDPDFYRVRASLYLTAGRVREAEKDISNLQTLDHSDVYGLAYQAVIALVKGNLEEAELLAQKALTINPDSSPTLVAMSYVQQASFQLETASQSIEKALKTAPDNGLLLARYAELLQSLDSTSRSAVEAGDQAVQRAPYLARPQTILGFAHLNRLEADLAGQFFAKAIELDQAAPLPRLGLGLVEIYNGNLARGRDNLSIAAILDPGNALIRSYLGKAYYEERDFPRAKKQLLIAKDLDPNDPTPYLYSAILYVKENQPGKGLLDLRKSMELNDNRAIFRSQLMLDKDLAARSVGAGRVFNQLGFEQLAITYGWKSLETAPSDYSSHRLLADSYSSQPRHEIARVSELLQSQLLQPINIAPVPPQLAEADLQILDGTGPSIPSFQEFHPLFHRQRTALLFNGVAGGDSTLGNDLVISGVYDKFSYSLGQFYYQSDGFRENNDQEQKLFNGYAQLRISPETHFMVELRSSDKENGDLGVLFDPQQFDPGFRRKLDVQSSRIGGHHSFTKSSEIIGSLVGQQHDENLFSENLFGSTSLQEDTDSINGELQYLFSGDSFKTVIGGAYYDGDVLSSFEFDGFPDSIPEKENSDHSTLYGYGYIPILPTITLTAGLNYNNFDNGRIEFDNELSPKVGLLWNPLQSTSLRVAWINGVTRNMISEQTVEPTQVSGFNQFYDDVPGTETEIFGFGIDHEVSKSLYGGASYIKRDLEVPSRTFVSGGTADSVTHWEEQVAKLYVYWLPVERISVAMEYLYENFERGLIFNGPDGFEELTTQRGKLKAAWFHPSGLRAEISETYVDQQGIITIHPIFHWTKQDSDSFWITDASIGYLLPKSYGLISLEIKNLFDTDFHFQDTDPSRPTLSQNQLIIFRFSCSF